ncbi:MAG: DUF1800 family protein [Planctomycetota bacterium]
MSDLTPISREEWSRSAARHLLNRAGFGVPAKALDHLARVGPEAAVETFVNFEKYPDVVTEPDFLPTADELNAYRTAIRNAATEDERRQLSNQFQQKQRQAVERLKSWWLNLMQFTTRPLQEKLTLFWAGHFATSAEKIQDPTTNYNYNRMLRAAAAGNVKSLVTQVGKSPSMLRYLDNIQNVKGHPNENWARELMELFTLGIGHYTEDDIKEAARAFSGWAAAGESFVYNLGAHDFGMKTVLGQRGLLDGEDVIRIIFEQPACATFISWKLLGFFACENPPDDIVAALATILRESNFELKPVLTALLRSKWFYSEAVVGAQIKSPVQYMIGLLETLGVTPGRFDLQQQRQVALLLRAMGQDLLFPPNVKGWYGNREWINTNTLLYRYNIAGGLVNGRIPENLRENLRLDETEDMMGDLKAREDALRRRLNAPFNVMAWARPLDGKPLGEVIDVAIEHFIGRPVDADRRRELIDSLAPGVDEKTPMKLAETNEIYLRGLVHLVTSMAEYQLC